MSAIAGILYFDESVFDPKYVALLVDAMKLRGPDAQSSCHAAPVSLGHCMLHTTPESLAETMPLISEDGSCMLVWDGRLDNRAELQKELSQSGCQLRDSSDAELVLHAYTKWGEDCPTNLLGDFAFAVWDKRINKLFCARDHVGARPFYFVSTDKFFAFASEDEALTLLPAVSGELNEARVVNFLEPRINDFVIAQSWLQDVWSLKAAQSASIHGNGLHEVKTYWELQPGAENQYSSEDECQQAFIEVFSEAVRCRMRCIGDVAIMMSGGLDSASIAATVQKVLPEFSDKKLHSYSTVSDDSQNCIESRCILDLVKATGAEAHMLYVPSFTGLFNAADLPEHLWRYAHPVTNSIPLSVMMCVAASNNGHRVLLHGVCGDVVTHVPLRYPAWFLRQHQWRDAWAACKEAGKHNHYLLGESALLMLVKCLWTAFSPFFVKRLWRFLRACFTHARQVHPVLNPALAEKFQLGKKLNALASDDENFPSLQAEHLRLLNTGYNLTSSIACYQYAAGKYGLELRDPWADKRVVEFFFRLPLRYKIAGGWTKYLVRRSFSQALSQQITWRLGKEHLSWPFYHQLIDGNAADVAEILRWGLPAISRYVNVQAVLDCYASYLKGKDDVERENIYDIITLILWNKRAKSG